MKKVDIKMIICQTTGIEPENYDRMINYLQDNGINISFPEKIGQYDSLYATRNIINHHETYNQETVDRYVPTNAETAFANEVGVDVKDVIKLGSYFEAYEQAINKTQWTVNISRQDTTEFLNEGALSTFANGRQSMESICSKLEISYDKETSAGAYFTPPVYQDYGYSIVETKDCLLLYKDGKNFGAVILEDGAQNKEFVSEFKEILDNVKGDMSVEQMKLKVPLIKNEIESENRFITEEKQERLSELKNREESLENRLANLEEKLKNNPSSSALVRLKAMVESQLDKVDAEINKIQSEEIANAEGYKVKIEIIRDGIEKDIESCNDALSKVTYDKVREGIERELNQLYKELDEANDKIAACDRKIGIATTVEEVEVQMNQANNAAQQFHTFNEKNSSQITDVAEENISKVDELQQKAKDFLINLDNWFGDLKDLAVEFANQVATETANSTASSTSDAYAQFDADIKDFLLGVVELCKDVKEIVTDVIDGYESIRGLADRIVDSATEEIVAYAKDKIDEIGDKLTAEKDDEVSIENE